MEYWISGAVNRVVHLVVLLYNGSEVQHGTVSSLQNAVLTNEPSYALLLHKEQICIHNKKERAKQANYRKKTSKKAKESLAAKHHKSAEIKLYRARVTTME